MPTPAGLPDTISEVERLQKPVKETAFRLEKRQAPRLSIRASVAIA
jgi:hypothetical protein